MFSLHLHIIIDNQRYMLFLGFKCYFLDNFQVNRRVFSEKLVNLVY